MKHLLSVVLIANLIVAAVQPRVWAAPKTSSLGPSGQTAGAIPLRNPVYAKNFRGQDLGEQINAADKFLGNARGEIVATGGTISTQVRTSHTLILRAGRYNLINPAGDTKRRWEGVVLLGDGAAIYGEGIGKVVLQEPANGYIVIQSIGSTMSERTYGDVGITRNITLQGFTIEGRNTVAEGGVVSAIKLGNANFVRIRDVELRNTSALGITAGGTGLTGNHAYDWIVENCIFKGVASQALNVVNGSRVIFRNNRFIDSGKFGNMGMSCIDLEPNTPDDVVQDVTIENNFIDSTGSPFLHGNAIMIQNGARSRDYGPVYVRRNTIIGGELKQGFVGNIASGIYLAAVQRIFVEGNKVVRVSHSGIRIEQGRFITVKDNELISTGSGGILSFEINDTTDSVFTRNRVFVDPRSTAATDLIAETGKSDRNTFEGNVCSTLKILGPNSVRR